MAEGTALEATLGLLPSAFCPVLAQVWVNTTVLCCCHLLVPLILPWGLSLVTLCTLRFHVLLTTALVRTLSAHLSGAMGWPFWPQPAQVGLELSQSSTAPWLLCRGKSKAALMETGPPPCSGTGQHERAAVLQDRLVFPSERAWMQRWWCGVSPQERVLSGRVRQG